MDLLLHKDCFIEYINCLLKPNKDNNQNLLLGILNNQCNRVVINKTLQQLISDEIPGGHPLRNFYELFVAQLINDRGVVINSNNESELDEVLEEIDIYYADTLPLNRKSGTYAKVSYNEFASLSNLNFASLQRSQKPNSNWIICNLAYLCPNSLTLRYSDYNNINEVLSSLNVIYGLANKKTFVNIFDRHQNLEHRLFDWFIGKCRVEYLTMRTPIVVVNDFVLRLRNKFTRAHVYVANNNNNIHERRVLFEGLSIEFDDDFINIDPARPTWKIDITCCETQSEIHLNKKATLFTKAT